VKGVHLTRHRDDTQSSDDANADERVPGTDLADVDEGQDTGDAAAGAEVAEDSEVPEVDAGGDGPDEPGDGHDDDDDGDFVAGLSWGRVAVLGAALLFFGFALATFLGRDTEPGPDSVDVGFYQDMVTHHDQALRLSSLELTNGSDPVVKGFAQEVITFQSYELGVMERTLAEWGYTRADRSDRAMAWMGMDYAPDQMPGMATEDEIDALADTEGTDTDAMFLDLMAAHHAGGLHMAQTAAVEADSDHVRALAERMSRNQAIEINEYARTAERLGLPVEIARVPVPDEDQ
jgi:uncharacterized protein (DUF305 family)